MTPNSILKNTTAANAANLNVKIPSDFVEGAEYLGIAGLADVNGAQEPAIHKYTPRAPQQGTYVLGSINGSIQWIETEACN